MRKLLLTLFVSVLALNTSGKEKPLSDSPEAKQGYVIDVDSVPPPECEVVDISRTERIKQRVNDLLNLDTIASMGKFPNLCIKIYRWGDKTFNTYNPKYVVGTGKKWNIKVRNNNWLDYYAFDISSKEHGLRMMSDLCSSVGISISFMAVSVGYDVNITKLIKGSHGIRKKWDFQFCCSLLALDVCYAKNTDKTNFTRIGKFGGLNIPFYGIDNSLISLETYYFFNNKKYSQAAAYNYSKLQLRNAGSFFAGVAVDMQSTNFDFNGLDDDTFSKLPEQFKKSPRYSLDAGLYSFLVGYGYNVVINKKWLFNFSISPTIGLMHRSDIDKSNDKYTFALGNIAKTALTFNSGNFFTSFYAKWDATIIAEKESSFVNSIGSFNILAGYRF